MKKLFVQWGGGNIGRSFIAQVFSRAGYRVVIIDINQALVDALNTQHSYMVETVFDQDVQHLLIGDVSAVHASDQEAINQALADADLLGISVGRGAWPHIAASLAKAIIFRHEQKPESPLDIILAENIHACRQFAKDLLIPHLGNHVDVDAYLGLAQTSIGKMVPIQDPSKLLVVRSEPYNELIVDREAFHHPLPSFADIHPVAPIEAYVDRKLFIHNMGHSTTAYLGFALHPECATIAQVLEDTSIRDEVRRAMQQSRDVLLALHPSVFSKEELDAHIEDLLTRFSNQALGDTVHRVGRDLERKLRYDDRLLGIIIEAERMGKDWDAIGRAYLKALSFTAEDSEGRAYPQDLAFLQSLASIEWPEKLCKASSWEEGDLEISLCMKIAKQLQAME